MATNSYGWASPQYAQPRGGGGPAPQGGMDPRMGGYGAPQQSQWGQGQMDYGMTTGMGMSPNGMPQQGGQFAPSTPLTMPDAWNNPWGEKFNKNNLFDPQKYMDENYRNMMEGYVNYGMVPYANMMNAERAQMMNEQFGTWDRNEQARLNSGQMDLAYRGSGREDEALRFGQMTNQRDFGEAQRQFNQQQQLDQMWKTGQLTAQQYQNETGRITAEAQARQGDRNLDLQSRLGDRNIDLQSQLGNRAHDVNMRGQDVERELGIGRLETDRYGMDIQRDLGQGRLGLDRDLGQGRLGLDRERDMGRLGLDTELGRGALGFQNRELDTNEAYRRSQLAQEADLTREKFQNDLTQSRYSAFGRAQAPNAKAVRSWY